MTIEIIKTQIYKFLSNEEAEVIAIKGPWGIGKTFTWNKFLLDAKKSNTICLDKYSYVSLFGVNSLDALKYAIFEHNINKSIIGAEATIDTFKENATDIIKTLGYKDFGVIKDIPILKNFSPAMESLSFLSINKSIICIDDLERKGNDLSIKDVLGLVSQLKEQKKCKVVFLLNENEEGLDDYEKYREKVVDIEFEFSPTASECSEIAFESNEGMMQLIPGFTNKLNIKNIRILKKIERLVKLAEPLVIEYESEIKYQVAHSLVLYAWCYYCEKDGAPSIKYILDLSYKLWGLGEENEDENTTKWKAILNDYEYRYTDGMDRTIADAVKSGYFTEDTFKANASIKNAEILVSKSQDSYSKTWHLYRDSFDDNKDELIEQLYKSFYRNVKNITLSSLNGTIAIFKELGEKAKAIELLDHFIQERKEEVDLFDLDQNDIFGDIKDPDILEKFSQINKVTEVRESIEELLERITTEKVRNNNDNLLLAETTVDEYYDLFKQIKGKKLSSYIRACLEPGQSSNANNQLKEISNRATDALKKIAQESDLNKLRVKSFGITI